MNGDLVITHHAWKLIYQIEYDSVYAFNFLILKGSKKLQLEKLERETGLKPATYALARHRSINWATPANKMRSINLMNLSPGVKKEYK